MFAKFPDETLFEVLLMSCNIGDRSMVALVQFVPHGNFDASAVVDLHPVLVPAEWFSELMPASLFLDIPNDAADPSLNSSLISTAIPTRARVLNWALILHLGGALVVVRSQRRSISSWPVCP